jgi:hypothetical protein
MILFTLFLTDKLTTLSPNNETQAVHLLSICFNLTFFCSFVSRKRAIEENLRRKHVQLWFSNEKSKRNQCVLIIPLWHLRWVKTNVSIPRILPWIWRKKPLFIRSPYASNRNADFICTVVLALTEIRKAKKSFVESWHVIDGLFSPDNATTHKVLQMILMIPCQLLPEQGRRNHKSHSLMQGPARD